MKVKIIIFVLLLAFFKNFAQSTFDILIKKSGCNQIAFDPIERKNDYLISYNKGGSTCGEKDNVLLTLSKQGKIIDSISLRSIIDKNFINQQVIAVGKEYYLFGYAPDSTNALILSFAKLDSSLHFLAKYTYKIPNLKESDTDKISVKINEDKSKFYFIFGQTFVGNSFVGSIDIDFKNFYIKSVNNIIGDVFDITELQNKKGYIIATIGSRFKSDLNFTKFEELFPSTKLFQSHQIVRLGNNYIMIGDEPLSRKLGVVLIDKNLSMAKLLKIGKTNDTVSKNTIRGVFVSNPNRFFVLGITYKDFGSSPDSWVNVSMIDSNLNLLGTRYYKGNGLSIPISIIETIDKHLVFTGTFQPEMGDGKYTAFVAKIKSETLITSSDKDLKFYEPLIKIFPNPVQDELIVEFQEYDNQHDIKLQIYNSLGKLVHSEGGNLPYQRINVHDFSNGIYFYNLYVANQIIKTGRFVKN